MTKLRQLWLLTALGSVLVLAGGYFLLVSPKASKAAAIRTEAADQEQANVRLQEQIKMLNQQKKDLPRQQAELQKFAARIPNNPAVPALVRALSNAAESSGVELYQVTQTLPTRVGTVAGVGSASVGSTRPVAAGTTNAAVPSAASGMALAQIPITIKATGSYSQISQFFSEIEALPRAFLTTNVSVLRNSEGGAGTKVNVGENQLLATVNGSLFMTTTPLAPTPVATPAAE